MNDDTYNGWTNRETWAFNLHWRNDQGLYGFVLESARSYLTDTYGDDWAGLPADEMRGADWGVGSHAVEHIEEELPEMAPELWENLRSDVGSFWRINYVEVGAAIREDIAEETDR